MKIVMLGTGYVGLVSGVCLADMGHHVVCVDRDDRKIDRLLSGDMPIYEPGLDVLVERNTISGNLGFSTDLGASLKGADAVFIAVGTPQGDGGHADLSQVEAAAAHVGQLMEMGTVVVTKSTVPVGTNRWVRDVVARQRPANEAVHVSSNPEFLREGAAIGDFMRPDRVVIGVETDHARSVMEDIYGPLFRSGFRVLVTDLESAELIKYGANAFLATKITFMNEMARLCDAAGADVKSVAHGMGLDRRIGERFLRPGPGYGGSCFPKDTSALAEIAKDLGTRMSIVEQVIVSNDEIKAGMVDRISDLMDGDLAGKTIAVLGVTFKPETDDMRDAPSLAILPALAAAGARLRICDPKGRAHGELILPPAEWVDTPMDAVRQADAVVILTEWKVFRNLDLKAMAESMARPRMADLRNVYNAPHAREAGFEAYRGVGCPGF